MSGQSSKYFFKQSSFRRTPKRYRKKPDELPQELRYAHLNPRLAAYLASKEKEKLADEISSSDDGLGSKSLLPQISETVQLIKNEFNTKLSNDEDSQRFLYQDSKNSAAGLLTLLSKILYAFELRKPHIPRSLEYQLLWGYKELTADVLIVPREWQLKENRDAYLQKLLNEQIEEERIGSLSDDTESVKSFSESKKKKKPQVVIQKTALADISEDDESPSLSMSRLSKMRESAASGGQYFYNNDGSPFTRRKRADSTSKESPQSLKPNAKTDRMSKMSLDPRRSVGETGSSRSFYRRMSSLRAEDVNSIFSDGSKSLLGQPSHLHMSTIQFQLSNKACEEKGWIVRSGKGEVEKETILEWATQRLQLSMKQSKEQLDADRALGYDIPIQIKYYGDGKKDKHIRRVPTRPSAVLKGAKPDMPAVPTEQHTGRDLLITTVSDGSTTIYYPSGRPAIMTSCATVGKSGFYTFVYDDCPDRRMMAVFTPTGKGCCYHDNGIVRCLITEKEGTLADEQGSVIKRWMWPANNMKLPASVILHLNSCVTFRCVNLTQMQIFFQSQKETAKVNVGLTSGAVEPKTFDELGQLLTGMPFISQAAKDCGKYMKPRQQEKSKHKKPTPRGKMAKEKQVLQDMQKVLDFTEPVDNDPDSDKELAKLQRKIKLLVDDWMEHYRIAVGIASPHLHGIREGPIHTRPVHSAKLHPSSLKPSPDVATSPSPRAPSAPPGHSYARQTESKKSTTAESSLSVHSVPSVVVYSPSVTFYEQPEEIIETFDPNFPPPARDIPSPVLSRTPSGKSRSKSPIRLSNSNLSDKSWVTLQGVCPVALRSSFLAEDNPLCKCIRHKIPNLTDIEYDEFVMNQAPEKQLIIVQIVSSLYPESIPACEMLSKLHADQNRNRGTRCCVQSRSDSFRLFRYDMATAADLTNHNDPLLIRRHNVVPGMFLIYLGGNLLFCDHIFNGYGNALKDFQKQLMQTRVRSSMGQHLPKDFHFSPTKGRRGPRSAWGGEIGGAGVDRHANPGIRLEPIPAVKKTSSASISSQGSDEALFAYNLRGLKTAAQYLSMSLSASGFHPRQSTQPTATQVPPPIYNKSKTTISTSHTLIVPNYRKTGSVK